MTMTDNVAILDVVAMLGLFFTAFFFWVSWEIITRRKALALLLAIVTFFATWLVASFIGAQKPYQFLIVELVAALVVFRVANAAGGRKSS